MVSKMKVVINIEFNVTRLANSFSNLYTFCKKTCHLVGSTWVSISEAESDYFPVQQGAGSDS